MSSTEDPKGEHSGGHRIVLLLLGALFLYSTLPFLGFGTYRTANGQLFFHLWYMVGFLLVAFFLMHEFITPLPPKETETE